MTKFLIFVSSPTLDEESLDETREEDVKRFSCESCKLKFDFPSHLHRHVLSVHEKRKRFDCDICSTGFNNKASLLRHLKKSESFACNLCDAKFCKRPDQKSHVKTVHLGVCKACQASEAGETADSSSRLVDNNDHVIHTCRSGSHVKTDLEGKQLLICDLCSCQYAKEMHLIKHYRTIHKVDRTTV